jgi:hypothetical protein
MSNNSKIVKKKVLSEKKPFTNKIKNKKEIDEFFDLDDTNVNPRYNSQIYTNPAKSQGDNDYYKQGLATITDKLALYANPRNWWQLYLRGYPIIRTINEQQELKDIIKELLSKRDDIDELVSKDENSSKIEKILKLINGLSDEELKTFKDKLNNLNK